MFNWLKRAYRATAVASTGVAAVFKWQLAFTEVVSRSGARHYDADFWEEVVNSFIIKWRQVEPASKDPAKIFEKRLATYLDFLKNRILQDNQKPLTPSELERVGEFIANASVLDLNHAIFTHSENVAPIFDLLPSAWLEAAGVTTEQFNRCYFQCTGKHRDQQTINMSFFDKTLGLKSNDEPLEAQMRDSAHLSPLHESCDEITNAKGSFGYAETNPIPVNGVEGERVYLFRLKAASGAGVFYHRTGSVNKTTQANQTIDIFEIVATDGSQWATLYFLMYFPRRSVKCPEGFSLKSWNSIDDQGKTLCKLPSIGSFFRVNNFPVGLPEALENNPGLKKAKMGSILAAKVRGLLSRNKGSWERNDEQARHNLESACGKEIADKIIAHGKKLNEQEREQFVQDFKEHFQKKIIEIQGRSKPSPIAADPPKTEKLPADSLYVYIKDEAKGPFTVEQLKALLAVETIGLDSLCCHEGSETWKTVNDYISSSQQNPSSRSRN